MPPRRGGGREGELLGERRGKTRNKMPYQFIEGIAGGDVVFEATGKSREELFIATAEATMNVMVEDLEKIQHQQEVVFNLDHREFDLLLFKFLNELIFLKDSKRLLVRIEKVVFGRKESLLTLEARGYGEPLDPEKHQLQVDVKAVTLHRFQVKQSEEGWKATVVLDV
jgi:SHS2 domain-containing protein